MAVATYVGINGFGCRGYVTQARFPDDPPSNLQALEHGDSILDASETLWFVGQCWSCNKRYVTRAPCLVPGPCPDCNKF